jgi:L-Ala-D/L-Glu epimerase
MTGRLIPIELELNREFVVAAGRASMKKNFIVLTDGNSMGEAAGSIFYGITPDDLRKELETLLGILKGVPPGNFDAVLSAEENRFSRPAICAVSTAVHDYRARHAGKPLYAHLGLDRPDRRKTSVTVSVGDIETLERYPGGEWAAAKIKMDADPTRTGQVIEAMHNYPEIRFRIDANGSWGFDDALRIIAEMPSTRVELIEQPFPASAGDDWCRLRQATTIPLFMDESVETAADVIRIKTYANGVNIKIQKSGRLETAIEAMRTARQSGMKVMLGCMIESSVGIAAAWHLSSLADYLDLDGRWLVSADPFEGLTYKDGFVQISGGEGHGISPARDI